MSLAYDRVRTPMAAPLADAERHDDGQPAWAPYGNRAWADQIGLVSDNRARLGDDAGDLGAWLTEGFGDDDPVDAVVLAALNTPKRRNG